MRIVLLSICLMLPLAAIADDHHIDFDRYTDFSALKTFAIREGRTDSHEPELNNALLLNRIADAIRRELLTKGLRETTNKPDVAVDFRIAAQEYSERRGGRADSTEGTLVVDLARRDSGALIWRGVYRDNERSNLKLAQKLAGDVKKLLSEYPPQQTLPVEPRPATLVTARLSPKAAAARALEVVQNIRRNTSFIGPATHPGLSISLGALERAAQTLAQDDGTSPAALTKRTQAFYDELNDAIDYASSIAGRGVETPNDRATARDLAGQLRALSNLPD